MYGGRQMNGQGWMSGQGNMGDLFGMSGPGMMMGRYHNGRQVSMKDLGSIQLNFGIFVEH
jgi:hypothetical protein